MWCQGRELFIKRNIVCKDTADLRTRALLVKKHRTPANRVIESTTQTRREAGMNYSQWAHILPVHKSIEADLSLMAVHQISCVTARR